jgi:hypothetical protein
LQTWKSHETSNCYHFNSPNFPQRLWRKKAIESTASSESPRQVAVFDSPLEALERAKAVDQQMKDAEELHKQENGM